ncbi:uncharacterized protein [Symphalangus syndactylus]|uniref:uncharacterized protein isoform X3 n=1 Tax=Symphalangus syndactylus TaxID=9590 RepID=UPI003005F4C4
MTWPGKKGKKEEGGRELWVKPEGGMPEAPRTPRSPRGQPSYRRRRRRTTTQTHTDCPPPPRRALCAGALAAPEAPPPAPSGLRRRIFPPGRRAPRSPVGCSMLPASFLPLLVPSSPGSKASLAGAVSTPRFRRKLRSRQIVLRISASRALLTEPTADDSIFSVLQFHCTLLGFLQVPSKCKPYLLALKRLSPYSPPSL